MAKQRLHLVVRGAVQGVGFRPFVYRLAHELELTGWVQNSAQGVFVDVEGEPPQLETFLLRVQHEHPPLASIQSFESSFHDPAGYATFEIRASDDRGPRTALVLPDIALCDDCLNELWNPSDRRYRYPFINCTNCGPRFSILHRLPYDRPNTAMQAFTMCPLCQQEYDDPLNRRFHAQPNACPVCGPRLELWDADGRVLAEEDAAARTAVEEILSGAIVAVKGIGGFHLLALAGDPRIVRLLRERKHREEKPFAVMVPSLDQARLLCSISPLEERLLSTPESPIVLLRRRKDGERSLVCDAVAPGNPALGLLLPYSPLHHVILRDAGVPLIATSGNISDEPICIDEREALVRLRGIADRFLVHNRPIVRHVDDSVVRIVLGRELVLRRARGYAPLPVSLPSDAPDLLAVGAHLKNTVAFSRGSQVFISQHLGDLETPEAFSAFQREASQLQNLFDGKPAAVVSDLHPDYLSTVYAHARPEPGIAIQHHIAHVAACMAENALSPPALGVAWDGTGLGTDGTIWGGEWFSAHDGSFIRTAHLRQFPLPGGDQAVREPRRSAVGLLYAMMGSCAFARTDLAPIAAWSEPERTTLDQMLTRGVNAPLTSSAGRLFDAVSALLGLRMQNRFEGQAAMELEWSATGITASPFPFSIIEPAKREQPFIVDWEPMIRALLDEVRAGVPLAQLAARFHQTLALIVVGIAERVELERVVLTGGCFQNVLLTELAVRELQTHGFRPYWHQRVPPNDGGISLGQVAAAAHSFRQQQALSGIVTSGNTTRTS